MLLNNMKKSIIFIIIIILVLLVFGLYFIKDAFVIWMVSSSSKGQNDQVLDTKLENTQNSVVDKCETLYQNFLTEYGTDYNTCFKDFNFSTSTCDGVAGSEDKNLNVLVILDSSGSMAGIVDGQKKIDIAKNAIGKFLIGLPDNAKVGLLVYGHKGSNSDADKALSCSSIDIIYPLSNDKKGLTTSLNQFDAMGWTPIADSLKKANTVFSGLDDGKNDNYVYIVSDGIETCGGDPVTVAKEINSSGIKAVVNVIGFDVDNSSANKLKSIATAGAGSFFRARNTSEFNKIFNENADWLSKTSCRNQQWLSATKLSNKAWLDMTSCTNNVWLTETRANNKIWLDTTRQLNDMYFKNNKTVVSGGFCDGLDSSKCRECVDYLSKKISDRHKEMNKIESDIKESNTNEKKSVDNYLNSI
jgi:Ca-activated chloride channel homolog